MVGLSSVKLQATSVSIFSKSNFLNLSKGIISYTSIIPSVIVPVLSRQRVSTRAKLSVAYKSCDKTLYLESLIILTANTLLVRRTSPSGIIPIIAATVFTTAV